MRKFLVAAIVVVAVAAMTVSGSWVSAQSGTGGTLPEPTAVPTPEPVPAWAVELSEEVNALRARVIVDINKIKEINNAVAFNNTLLNVILERLEQPGQAQFDDAEIVALLEAIQAADIQQEIKIENLAGVVGELAAVTPVVGTGGTVIEVQTCNGCFP